MKALFFLSLFTISLFPSISQNLQPSFPGGNEALNIFVKENLVYPFEAREMGIEGVVKVKILIDEKGEIQALRILACEIPAFEESAIQVIKEMPNWIPAKANGKPVKAAINLSIQFRLDI